ncbi:hypothetical protein [Cohnella candidum]|uniref:Uncharacterized protein n=1 Tax=Cohnella candidum TaxID=2674991 RepID=A0A3G3JVV4_9BACL|nr:hypothetical protein [Cohnella candidum]AYQ72362.1 hypothetical protein EAV92_07120 [Cohnella candidum]
MVLKITAGSIIVLILVLFGSACTGSKKEVTLYQNSLVRWHAHEKMLEVYAVAQNKTDDAVSFRASVVWLNAKVGQAVGLNAVEIVKDDRNGKPPFRLEPHSETVFHEFIKTNGTLTRDLLAKGVGIEITMHDRSYTLPISYGEIE